MLELSLAAVEAPEVALTEPEQRRVWITGLRRSWAISGALRRWTADRGVTGAVWTPGSYEIEDVAEAAVLLVDAGARPDASLLHDLAVTDIRGAAEAVRRVDDGTDGFVVAWLDPTRVSDPAKAVAAAGELVGEVGRPNVAVGLAWTPQRGGVVEALLAADVSVALAAVRDDAARRAVEGARERALTTRRADTSTEEQDVPVEVEVPPVFLLGERDAGEGIFGVELITEFEVFRGGTGAAKLPLSPDAEQTGLKAAIDRLAQRAREPVRSDEYRPVSFAAGVIRECRELQTDMVLDDVWAGDHTIWKDDPTEIADRLGWLDAPERYASEVGELTEFGRKTRSAADVAHVVVCGMGGSVFAPEMFSRVLGGAVPLTILDTTHPGRIEAVRSSLDLDKTLFVISSKSGTTVETRSHLEYFWSLVGRGDRFVAITDPGTELAALGKEREFRRVFENEPTIGGRFSGLSYFGLVPAALAGVDVSAIVGGARRAMIRNAPGVAEVDSTGARLGSALGESVLHESRDKLTLILPPPLSSFEIWLEQLLAESLGKEDKGLVPVVNEPLGPPTDYASDRLFCVYTLGDEPEPAQLEQLSSEHPVVRIGLPEVKGLGAEMYRWEVAVAIVGYLLDINPFDQPDVESAKRRAREALQRPAGDRPDAGSPQDVLTDLAPPRYLAIQAFIANTPENADRLEAIRRKFRERYRVAVTVGFGPRFLHSTGQLHKAGPNTGVFLQVIEGHESDVDVPGMGYTFGRLFDAQADGDLQALRDVGRPVARLTLPDLEALSAG